jgi:MFS family permease
MTASLGYWSVWAIGFVARPVGSILFGHLGDTRGRRPTLLLSILCVSVPTILIGALPTHQQAGEAAPVLMAIMRLVQGLAVGGEVRCGFLSSRFTCRTVLRCFRGLWPCLTANYVHCSMSFPFFIYALRCASCIAPPVADLLHVSVTLCSLHIAAPHNAVWIRHRVPVGAGEHAAAGGHDTPQHWVAEQLAPCASSLD